MLNAVTKKESGSWQIGHTSRHQITLKLTANRKGKLFRTNLLRQPALRQKLLRFFPCYCRSLFRRSNWSLCSPCLNQ